MDVPRGPLAKAALKSKLSNYIYEVYNEMAKVYV